MYRLTVFYERWRVPLEVGTRVTLEELVSEGQELAQKAARAKERVV